MENDRNPPTPSEEGRLLDSLKAGNTRKASYAAARVSSTTFHCWLEHVVDFRKKVEEAEAFAEQYYVKCVTDAAPTTPSAAQWWLSRRRKEDYGDASTVNHSGGIQIGLGDVLRDARAERKQHSADGDAPPGDVT